MLWRVALVPEEASCALVLLESLACELVSMKYIFFFCIKRKLGENRITRKVVLVFMHKAEELVGKNGVCAFGEEGECVLDVRWRGLLRRRVLLEYLNIL